MRVRLTPLWSLTDELEDSFPGQAVLVNQGTGEAFGPGDILEPYPYWELKPAAFHAAIMSNMEEHTNEESAFIRRFRLSKPVLSAPILGTKHNQGAGIDCSEGKDIPNYQEGEI